MQIAILTDAIMHLIAAESRQWVLWLPVCFGVGILIYFTSPSPIPYSTTLLTLFLYLYLAFIYRNKPIICALTIIVIFTIAGFLTAKHRIEATAAPRLQKPLRAVNLEATIHHIEKKPHEIQLLLSHITIESLEAESNPTHIRLNIRTQHPTLLPGAKIATKAMLSPPPIAVLPQGYDFSFHSYFKKIGAIGYAITPVKIVKNPQRTTLSILINSLRNQITNHINNTIKQPSAGIASALLVGKRGGIEKPLMEDIRNSGLAHLLAISGMHLALVACISFFSLRLLLALSSYITLHFNTKKWAACGAIIASACYLCISGAPISAQRAFIMVSIMLCAILIDRQNTPIRAVALAALIVLILTPESILTPSFQMSFAAALSLIASFTTLSHLLLPTSHDSWVKRFILYSISLIISSLIAGIATAPFAIYHFNHVASYSVLANIIAIPLTSFWIMPLGLISLLLMPLYLHNFTLNAMGWGIDILLYTAHHISSLPLASHTITSPTPIAMTYIVLGGLWLCLFTTPIRLLGVLLLSIGLWIPPQTTPDLIISQEGSLFAIKDHQGELLFSSLISDRFSRTMWRKHFGQENERLVTNNASPSIRCDTIGCIYKKKGYTISIAFHPLALADDCKQADILINLTFLRPPCKQPVHIINRYDLLKQGTHTITLDQNITIKKAKNTKLPKT